MSELPDGWVVSTFDDVILTVTNGLNGKQNKVGNGIPVSRIETIAEQTINYDRIGYIRDFDPERVSRYRLMRGDVLFSHINSPSHLGKTAIYDDKRDLYHGINLLRIVLNGAMVPKYFDNYCKYIRGLGEFAANAQHSVNQSSINQKKLKLFSIPIPPLNEQIRIANKLDQLLDKVDTAKTRLDKVPTILKRFRHSVLAAATAGKLTEERIGKKIDWQRVLLKDVGEGFNYGTSTKSNTEGKVPVLRMGNLQQGEIDWKKLVYTSDDLEIEKYRLENGDVLFNRTNSPELVGKTSIYRGEKPAIFAGYLIRVKCGKNLIPGFLNIQLNSPDAREYCWRVKTDGVSQSNINAKKLQAYEFLLPSIEEQNEIVRRVDSLLLKTERIEKQYGITRVYLDKLIQSILAKTFQGKLVPQDSNDEPAQVLLKRIEESQILAPKKIAIPKATVLKSSKNKSVINKDIDTDFLNNKVVSILAKQQKALTAQEIFDQAEGNTFEAIDHLFEELNRLLNSGKIIKKGQNGDHSFMVK